MSGASRRSFLKLGIRTAPAALFANRLSVGVRSNIARDALAYRTPATIDRYIDRLPLLNRLAPVETSAHGERFSVRMVELMHPFHSQIPPAHLWGYEGQYPGPTIEALRGRPIVVRWENRLPARHLFAVDSRIHGAMPPAPAVRTVPHLHGSRTRSLSDGLPERWFTPGAAAEYSYPNDQPAATLWYHDHAVGITRLNVYAGLSGFYLLRDDHERVLGLPSGKYEVPLLIQDRTLDDQGQLVYAPSFEDGSRPGAGAWAPEFFGDIAVVNGAIYPYLEVEPRAYRLRILNGANARFFNLFFNLAKSPTDVPSLQSFQQIGTDGGFLPRPVELKKLLLAPAERADVLVDFAHLEGRTVTLSNSAPAPYPGWEFSTAHHRQLYELMQFRVVAAPSAPTGQSITWAPPALLPLDDSVSVITRDLVLTEKMDAQGRSLGVRINSKSYDDPVTEIVKLGSVEKWRFINATDDAHPMHLHLVQFHILHRQGYNPAAFAGGTLQLVGNPRPPAANEAGWKDTAVVNPREVLTILVRFEGYAGRYVFHCHMLEHEDNDMMRPYEVVA
jgi:spore coat protein A, manganese oxidase